MSIQYLVHWILGLSLNWRSACACAYMDVKVKSFTRDLGETACTCIIFHKCPQKRTQMNINIVSPPKDMSSKVDAPTTTPTGRLALDTNEPFFMTFCHVLSKQNESLRLLSKRPQVSQNKKRPLDCHGTFNEIERIVQQGCTLQIF